MRAKCSLGNDKTEAATKSDVEIPFIDEFTMDALYQLQEVGVAAASASTGDPSAAPAGAESTPELQAKAITNGRIQAREFQDIETLAF